MTALCTSRRADEAENEHKKAERSRPGDIARGELVENDLDATSERSSCPFSLDIGDESWAR
jgi:hypothetical protein